MSKLRSFPSAAADWMRRARCAARFCRIDRWRRILTRSDWRLGMAPSLPLDLPVLNLQKARACPKPNRFERQAKEQIAGRDEKAKRHRLRTRIYIDDHGKCRHCGRKVHLKLKDAPHEFAVGHVHEWIFRSLGGDWLDPFNCLLLCAECHPLCQQLKLQIVCHDLKRLVRGPVDFIPNAPIVLLSH